MCRSKLADVEAVATVPEPASALADTADGLRTPAEVAAELGVSRPYVSMLCDTGKLGEVVLSQGGRRTVRASAVPAYAATLSRKYKRAVSPRQAGVEAGLYDHPEGYFANVMRAAPTKVAAPAKAARKLRR